jgi:hypothetical protein
MQIHRFASLAAVLSLVLATSGFAQFTLEPRFGPERGGTEVTITGPFGSWPYSVGFGAASATTTRVNDTTIVAVTPPGTGTVPVRIIEDDMGIAELEFTYVPTDDEEFERLLVPLLTPPANGAHGSQFKTELRAYNRSRVNPITIEGIGENCPVLCAVPIIDLLPGQELQPEDVRYAGTPGRFAYVPRGDAEDLWTNLRVFDTSRSEDNYGTTIPVVRERDMFIARTIAFSGIPTDPLFRNTLRIYGVQRAVVFVDIDTATSHDSRQVTLEGAGDPLTPAYAVIGDLPSDVGPLRITILPPGPGELGFATPMWAFVSVTNNDTQMITVVTP